MRRMPSKMRGLLMLITGVAGLFGVTFPFLENVETPRTLTVHQPHDMCVDHTNTTREHNIQKKKDVFINCGGFLP